MEWSINREWIPTGHRRAAEQLTDAFARGDVPDAAQYAVQSLTDGRRGDHAAVRRVLSDIWARFAAAQLTVIATPVAGDRVEVRYDERGARRDARRVSHHGGLLIGATLVDGLMAGRHVALYRLADGWLVEHDARHGQDDTAPRLRLVPATSRT